MSALQRGVIDALAYFDTGFGQIDAPASPCACCRGPERPADRRAIHQRDSEFPQGNRKIAVGFARAVNKASEFLLANPEAGAAPSLKLDPKPRRAAQAKPKR